MTRLSAVDVSPCATTSPSLPAVISLGMVQRQRAKPNGSHHPALGLKRDRRIFVGTSPAGLPSFDAQEAGFLRPKVSGEPAK